MYLGIVYAHVCVGILGNYCMAIVLTSALRIFQKSNGVTQKALLLHIFLCKLLCVCMCAYLFY